MHFLMIWDFVIGHFDDLDGFKAFWGWLAAACPSKGR
jgi:hypothetical protein